MTEGHEASPDARGAARHRVDVAICAYGKPFQTAVTLASLRQHSGQHIDRIYFQEERHQPYGDEVAWVAQCFVGANILHRTSDLHLGWMPTDKKRLKYDAYRMSIRYQYAWEHCDKDFLFIVHNDCLFDSDIIGGMLRRLRDRVYAGVGMIGQCWNCPAHAAHYCDGDRYEDYKPSLGEALELVRTHPSPRTKFHNINRESPMPLPECRLNEFGCLINLAMLRHLVVPHGDIEPLGTMSHDTGTDWFQKLVRRGYRFLNWHEGMTHGPFSPNANGHAADLHRHIYDDAELRASGYLDRHFADVAAAMRSCRPTR